MRLLYLDHSGDMKDADQKHFVLAGLSIFERQTYWVSKKLDDIAARFDPSNPASVELHASPMRGGRSFWRRFKVVDRIAAIKDALAITSDIKHNLTLFGASIEKSIAAPFDPVEWSFEEVCKRFDKNLMRMHKSGNTERGIIIFDKASYEQTVQNLATDFRTIGHTWGVVRNLSEVPLFLDSRASRLLQLADLVTFAIKRAVENSDFAFYNVIRGNFDPYYGSNYGFVSRNSYGSFSEVLDPKPLSMSATLPNP